ncbi:Uncharacterized protein BM_BM1321 [Brugia malayi]|uniref:Bm1321 n=1 Tax=Brugia malayi TaxID=6279 RepID=A0A0J9XV10_BRUMA|nr:Uncharacterized protein BM_BM1321 [Brugia malayi]CDP95820.1 Bm1321 [Brugia malayi]VIO99663.1 Uncharacterized protein BM_BM1321 [Brugia malayi]
MISFFRKIYLNERIQRLEELSFREENSRQSPLISSYIKVVAESASTTQ